MARWVIVRDVDGALKKVNLDTAQALGIQIPARLWNLGISVEEVYLLPSRKVVLQTYSIWQRGNSGEVWGRQYHLASAEEIARLADWSGDPRLLELVPEEEYGK